MANKRGHGRGQRGGSRGSSRGREPKSRPGVGRQQQQEPDYGDYSNAFRGFGAFSMKDEAKETGWKSEAFSRSHLWKNRIVFVSGGNLDPSELLFPQHPTEDHGEAQALVDNPALPSLPITDMTELSLEDNLPNASESDSPPVPSESEKLATSELTVREKSTGPLPEIPSKSNRRSAAPADATTTRKSSIAAEPEGDTIVFQGRRSKDSRNTQKPPQPSLQKSSQKAPTKSPRKPTPKPSKARQTRQEEEAAALADYMENIERQNQLSDDASDLDMAEAIANSLESSAPEPSVQRVEASLEVEVEIATAISISQVDADAELARELAEQQEAADEDFARLLAKQEELGLGNEDLVLYDDTMAGLVGSEDELSAGDFDLAFDMDDDEDEDDDDDDDDDDGEALIQGFFAAAQKGQLLGPVHEGEYPVASELADAYDVMDLSRPSLLVKRSRKKGAIETIIHDDPDLEAQMRRAWQTDRDKKVARKIEKQREKDLLKNKDESTMDVNKIISDIDFWLSSGTESLQLPPMSNYDRKSIHVVAQRLTLKSKSTGPKVSRFTTLVRTRKAEKLEELPFPMVNYLLKRAVQGHKAGIGGPAITKGGTKVARGGNWQQAKEVSYKDGQVVGASAPEIGTENLGRQMLEKMGWTKGTALGAENNKGRLVPVEHVVKVSRTGLGQS